MNVAVFTQTRGVRHATGSIALADKADGQIAIVTMDCPSPADWTATDRARFLKILRQALYRRSARAVILTGPRLFNDDAIRPHDADFDQILSEIISHSTPVIAAIPGNAKGQGLELALACSARIAATASMLALPDMAAAQLPNAHTLERLLQLAGVDLAVSMVALGEVLDARSAKAAGLVNAVADGEIAHEAIRLAWNIADPKATIEDDTARIQAEFLGARVRLRRQAPGQTAIMFAVRALEAAALAPRRRVRYEIARIAAELGDSAQAEALRYASDGALQLSGFADRGALDAVALTRPLRWPLLREAIHLIDDGAIPAQVDRCLEAYGFVEGPFAESDRLGQEAVFAIERFGAEDPWIAYSSTLDLMWDCGRRGGLSAPGWLGAARSGGDPATFPDVEGLLRSSAISQRRQRRRLDDETIVDRSLYAAINASAKLLELKPELGAQGVDAIWTSQLGFPKWKGGPLFQAQRIGLPKVVQMITDLDTAWGTAGAPCELLVRAETSGSFEPRSSDRAISSPPKAMASA